MAIYYDVTILGLFYRGLIARLQRKNNFIEGGWGVATSLETLGLLKSTKCSRVNLIIELQFTSAISDTPRQVPTRHIYPVLYLAPTTFTLTILSLMADTVPILNRRHLPPS